METNVNYTLVGLFVIGLITATILGIIWLSTGFSSAEGYAVYQVNMKEAVTGLSLDAPVEYNGVNVGAVQSIQIDHSNPHLVGLLLKIKNDTPITMGTRAKLDLRSLSGIAYMALDDRGTDMTPLRAEKGQLYPIIATTPSIFVRLDIALTQLNENFHQVSKSIQSLFNEENLRSVKLILQSGQNTMRQFETQTIPTMNQAIINLNEMAQNLSGITTDIKQNPAVLIRGKQQPVLGPGEQ